MPDFEGYDCHHPREENHQPGQEEGFIAHESSPNSSVFLIIAT